jgi:hypothetical protein
MANEKMSFKGYSIKVWAVKNKDNLKMMLSGAVGLITAMLNGISTPTGVAVAGLAVPVSKLIIDGFDYWLSE